MSTLETMTLTIAIVGVACGVLGAVLGIINTWHQISTTRVKLRVVPKLAKISGDNVTTTDRPSHIHPPKECVS